MKAAFLTSYNSDLIRKDFKKFLEEKKIDCDCWWNSYSTQEQSVYDSGSVLYSFAPDVVIIHFEIEWFLGDAAYDTLSLDTKTRQYKVEEIKSKLQGIISTVSNNLPKAKIVIQNFIFQSDSLLGLLNSNIELGIDEITIQLNKYLTELRTKFSGKLILQGYDSLVSSIGKNNCFDSRMLRLAKSPFAKSFYSSLFHHYYSIIHTLTVPRKKCIVVDLDNTLWGGIVGQDGYDKIELGGNGIGEAYVHFQKALLNFYRKGIFLAVCSKNNLNDALEVIENHPDMILRKKYFSSLKINWLDKAANIRAIAEELNIGIDSLVFLDDNPVECELVKQQLPEVETINLTGDPDSYTSQLLSISSLQTVSITEEDLSRNVMYAADEKRRELVQSFTDLNDFYKSLEMEAHISINDLSQVSRIAQLTQKTNQFNLTTRRYSVEEIKSFIDSGDYRIYSLRLTDKFGDNGIVLVAIIKTDKNNWHIDTLLMSCRVIGRQAETAMLNTILTDAKSGKAQTVSGEFIETKKNLPAKNFYAEHGFENISGNLWQIVLPAKLKQHFIKTIG